MHGRHLLLAVYCLLSFCATPLSARLTQQYRQWVRGVFDLPAEIARAASVSQLQPFLESEQEFTRMAAVRRAGQIEGPRSLPILLDIFAREKSPVGSETVPLVKLEVIRILDQIGSEQSKSALLDILKRYWQDGPRVKDKKGYRLDADFAGVLVAVLRTITAWRGDPAAFEMLEDMALSNHVRDFYTGPRGLGQTIWEAYLKGKMRKEGIIEGEQSLMYLLDFMYAMPRPIAYGTVEEIKYRAAFANLQDHAESVLSSLAGKLAKELVAEDAKSQDDVVRKRIDELSFKRGCISRALREKASLAKLGRNPVSLRDRPQPIPDASK